MSNAAVKSVFPRKQDLNEFLNMYLSARNGHSDGVSEPSASAPHLLATPTLPLISQDDLFAKSRQALLGTDDGVSRPAKTKAIEAADAPDLVSPESKRLRSEAPASSGGAAQPAESELGLLPMPTERSPGDANRWAAGWVTKAIGAELRRLQPFAFRRSEEKVDPKTVSQTGGWTHFLHKLERCVVAHTRQELGVGKVERWRRFSDCDALDTAKTAVIALKYKLQSRSPEFLEEFCSLARQLVENARRFVAADLVLQRVLTNCLTSSEEQRREAIVSAINAEMEKTFSCRRTTLGLMRELGHRGLPPRSGASASSGGAAQPADSVCASTGVAAQPADCERRLMPRPPSTLPPSHLLDNSVSDVQGPVEAQSWGFVHDHGKARSVIGLRNECR